MAISLIVAVVMLSIFVLYKFADFGYRIADGQSNGTILLALLSALFLGIVEALVIVGGL